MTIFIVKLSNTTYYSGGLKIFKVYNESNDEGAQVASLDILYIKAEIDGKLKLKDANGTSFRYPRSAAFLMHHLNVSKAERGVYVNLKQVHELDEIVPQLVFTMEKRYELIIEI